MPDPDPPRRRRVTVEGLTPRKAASTSSTPFAPAPAQLAPFIVGHGYDLHRLQPTCDGKRLVLSGVVISDAICPVSHSDGDVVLHALVDALLGAIGAGDIGEMFPNTDPRWKNADSRIFVDEAWRRVRQRGYGLGNLDVTVMLERPKVGPHKAAMIGRLRELLGPAGGINLKAATNEGCDAIGRGEAVAAHAVVLLSAEV
jgi:2-C-methyl-D-erythritol 2,4-cyclodiphosphate synthase